MELDPVTGTPVGEPVRDRTVIESIKASLSLLTKRDRNLFGLAALAQMALSLLDLAGIALIGAIGVVAVSGIDPNALPETVNVWKDRFGLGGLTASQLIGLLAASAVVLLLLKTLLSALITRRMLHFLANRQADVSARMARTILSRQLLYEREVKPLLGKSGKLAP